MIEHQLNARSKSHVVFFSRETDNRDSESTISCAVWHSETCVIYRQMCHPSDGESIRRLNLTRTSRPNIDLTNKLRQHF